MAENNNSKKLPVLTGDMFRILVEQSLVGIYIGQDDRFQYVNPKFAEIFGYTPEEILSFKSASEIVAEKSRELVYENIRKRFEGEIQSIHYIFKGKQKDGTIIDVETFGTRTEINGRPAIIGTLINVTDRLKTETENRKIAERLFREQKEETVITLAAGIAHDFNNILMAVLGNAELLKMKLTLNQGVQNIVDGIIVSAERMADLTRQLMAYAKIGKYQLKTISMNEVIQGAINMSHKGKTLEMEVILDLSDDLWPVWADSGQMSQMLINLFANAFEAMEAGRGVLKIHTENVNNKSSWECLHGVSHSGGDYIYIRISDNGTGIPFEIRKRIFEPFFTTKFMGRGLGLSAAIGIVQNHHGCISFESETGQGTVFHIYLPRAKPIEAITAEKKHPEAKQRPKILIIDDEPQILSLLESILTNIGYEVLSAHNGVKALEIFSEMKDDIVLTVLDIVLPDIDGIRLFKEFKAIKPEQKVLMTSGYDEETALKEMGIPGPEDFIQKPYRRKILEEKVREILER